MAIIRVGISGWTYPAWRGDFYPPGLAHRRELAYAATRLGSIELNGSFYSLQRPSSFASWRDQTPDGFVLSVKGGRFITHLKRLADVETALANFFASGLLALGPKLGPVLWQLPPTLAYDPDRLTRFFDLLPRTTNDAAGLADKHDDKVPDDQALLVAESDRPIRHALEVRHGSFAVPEAVALLRRHDIGFVVADTAGTWPLVREITTDFVYARLHGADELYVSGYTDDALDRWAATFRSWHDDGFDVYVYFDNDAKVRAPHDAMALMRRLGLHGAGEA
ncbi:MAG: DUF72 domain-containing protein [Nocardioidaceae bacterium]